MEYKVDELELGTDLQAYINSYPHYGYQVQSVTCGEAFVVVWKRNLNLTAEPGQEP